MAKITLEISFLPILLKIIATPEDCRKQIYHSTTPGLLFLWQFKSISQKSYWTMYVTRTDIETLDSPGSIGVAGSSAASIATLSS
ncbi:hypothetical protein SAMN06264941_1012 [Methanohalophilus portucalensis FDF-1]|uniref:Uncharacterized protein n=1 Tax=Methanohalophilus portucalensis FDF-1 TaxID=523843 RepID=A0A1X7ND66_9EURY|nr:hypothetical protein SAMN06264941_1012 [Methanohalophilus portucalensis FDF-1]